jgi:hypothetical protein
MHDKALEIYQRLLAVAPEMSPDPRIGLGLSLWMLGDKGRARLAWNRALKRVRLPVGEGPKTMKAREKLINRIPALGHLSSSSVSPTSIPPATPSSPNPNA